MEWERGGKTKVLEERGKAESRGGCLKKGVGWNPLINYDYTNYHLHRCWMYIFSWRYFPVSLFDILNLARDSLLKCLCCYFLLSLSQLLASLLCVCTCVCACVCVFILFHLLASSGSTTSGTYVRGSDQRSFVEYYLHASAKSDHLSI